MLKPIEKKESKYPYMSPSPLTQPTATVQGEQADKLADEVDKECPQCHAGTIIMDEAGFWRCDSCDHQPKPIEKEVAVKPMAGRNR